MPHKNMATSACLVSVSLELHMSASGVKRDTVCKLLTERFLFLVFLSTP